MFSDGGGQIVYHIFEGLTLTPLGEFIERRCNELGIHSVRQLERLCRLPGAESGLSDTWIKKLSTGRSGPRWLSTLNELAIGLQVTIAELLIGSGMDPRVVVSASHQEIVRNRNDAKMTEARFMEIAFAHMSRDLDYLVYKALDGDARDFDYVEARTGRFIDQFAEKNLSHIPDGRVVLARAYFTRAMPCAESDEEGVRRGLEWLHHTQRHAGEAGDLDLLCLALFNEAEFLRKLASYLKVKSPPEADRLHNEASDLLEKLREKKPSAWVQIISWSETAKIIAAGGITKTNSFNQAIKEGEVYSNNYKR